MKEDNHTVLSPHCQIWNRTKIFTVLYSSTKQSWRVVRGTLELGSLIDRHYQSTLHRCFHLLQWRLLWPGTMIRWSSHSCWAGFSSMTKSFYPFVWYVNSLLILNSPNIIKVNLWDKWMTYHHQTVVWRWTLKLLNTGGLANYLTIKRSVTRGLITSGVIMHALHTWSKKAYSPWTPQSSEQQDYLVTILHTVCCFFPLIDTYTFT